MAAPNYRKPEEAVVVGALDRLFSDLGEIAKSLVQFENLVSKNNASASITGVELNSASKNKEVLEHGKNAIQPVVEKVKDNLGIKPTVSPDRLTK